MTGQCSSTGRPALLSLRNVHTLPNPCTTGRTNNKPRLLSALSGNSQQRLSFFPRSRRAAGSLLVLLCGPSSPGADPGGLPLAAGDHCPRRRGPPPRPRPPARPRPTPALHAPGTVGRAPCAPGNLSQLPVPPPPRLPPPRPTQARLTLVRICPDVDTLRISFWGPSCSASLSDESSPVPADAAAGVTAAPAPAAAPPAAPGGWCWPPAPAILSDSCGDTAPPGGGGGGRQWGGSARAGPGAPSLAAAAIFRSSNGPRGAGSQGSGAPELLRAARARAADAVVTMDVEPGPSGTPAHPPRDGIGVPTQNTTSADREDGVDRERDNLQLPLRPGVPRMDGGDEKPPWPPLAGPAVAMLPPSAHWQQGQEGPWGRKGA